MIAGGRCSSCNDRITVVFGVKVYHGICDPHARMVKLEALLTRLLAFEDQIVASEFYVPQDHDAVIEEARALVKEAEGQRRRG